MPIDEILGRERELASIAEFLSSSDTPAALVLEGEAGIGKSTLWVAAVAAARDRGFLVLESRPAEVERGLAHVALGDLFEDVLDYVLPELSPPRRRAVEVAFLREDAEDVSVDRRTLAVAVRDVLHLLAERKPVVVAVDDVQWLDPSSFSALAFALRRLAGDRVLVVLSRRQSDAVERTKLEDALGTRVSRLRVASLSVGAMHALLRNRLGRPFARQTLLRIHERSGGNPFFALELGGALGGDIDPLEPLPVPETLGELVHARLAGLPEETREALELAAAVGTPSQALLERAGVLPETLEPALAANVIERENGAIRFTHPLLASALYPAQGEERRSVHARIAAVVDDAVVHARHLALARDAPDPHIASALDDAATIAADRGASAAAAELAEHAIRLTPEDARAERYRRAIAAARAQRVAGEWTRAREIAADLLAESDLGPLRAEALVFLAELEALERAIVLLDEALSEAGSQPALRARIHCRLAWTARFKKGFVGAREHAHAALELANDLNDDALRVHALERLIFLGGAVGDPDVPAHAARAHELATAVGDDRLLSEATVALAGVLTDAGDFDEARALVEREYKQWHERDELWSAQLLHSLAWIELWDGRWQLAAEYAARSLELNVQYGLDVPWNHLPLAVVAAHRGQLEVARAHSELALRLAEEQFGRHTPVHIGTLGVVALQGGDLDTATQRFEEAAAVTSRLGWHDASHRWWVADHVEALLELGRMDDAMAVLDAWETDAARLGRNRMLAHATRCRGLAAAARGAIDDAAVLLEVAISQHEQAGDRFGRARALLALGVVRRRARQKRAARDAIDAALAEFEGLGAATWVEKARAELGRIGGRTRTEGLTAAERRVAALVAEGHTNREVATALFLGERTVETHLSHVYAKLGVRSRAELARKFRADEQSSGELTISS